jgi:hypothetical protein
MSFDYDPYVTPYRFNSTRTCGGVVFEEACPCPTIPGDGMISWRANDSSVKELLGLYDIYSACYNLSLQDEPIENPLRLIFKGIYGEQLEIKFIEFKAGRSDGCLRNPSGKFQVLCEILTSDDRDCESILKSETRPVVEYNDVVGSDCNTYIKLLGRPITGPLTPIADPDP